MGQTSETINTYLEKVKNKNIEIDLFQRNDRQGNGFITIQKIYVYNHNLDRRGIIRSGDNCSFYFKYKCIDYKIINNLKVAFGVVEDKNRLLVRFSSEDKNSILKIDKNEGLIRCNIPKIPFSKGTYSIGFMVKVNNEISDYISGGDAFAFEVNDGNYFGYGINKNTSNILVDNQWEVVDE
jgi:endo-1,4-beta-mannosidase